MVGSAIAKDLAKDHQVTVTDLNPDTLNQLNNKEIDGIAGDLRNPDFFTHAIMWADLVVSAVPGFMGFDILDKLITAGKNVVDISFFPEDCFLLREEAISKGVTVIVDCGVAPGMSNLLLGKVNEEMSIQSFTCMVGGLPKKREFPFEYKAPFSPIDVIEEYTRPARYVENNRIVTVEALSDIQEEYFEEVGKLESFNTDGLRSIMFTMPHIPNMKEKTLRYPGHALLMRAFREAGFFSETPLKPGAPAPLSMTANILFDKWKLHPGDEEFTIMRNVMTGIMNGQPTTVEYTLYDEYDHASGISSMSRTTGYTCTAAVNLVLSGRFAKKGIFPPELIGSDPACFDFIMQYLGERNIRYTRREYAG
jgi:saccharopine dehydrogenase-like NADP-dependent oxidoreductase